MAKGARQAAKRTTADPRRREVLLQRARQLAARGRETAAEATPAIRVLLCAVTDNLFALPLETVAHVRPLARLGAVPDGGPVIGLLADRGRIHRVADLGALLGLAPAPQAASGHVVIMRPPLATALHLAAAPSVGEVQPPAPGDDRAAITSADPALVGRTAVLLRPEDLAARLNPAPAEGA